MIDVMTNQVADYIKNRDTSKPFMAMFSFYAVHQPLEAKEKDRKGQDKGNSGVFLQGKYEVQILNSYENRTYSNGQAASVYKQHIPLVNAMRPPGEWNVYDIIFHAPEFGTDGKKTKSGTFTVIHNGILVQDHVEILGTTEYIGPPKNTAHGEGPIFLQDHSNKVSFRNIWLRKL